MAKGKILVVDDEIYIVHILDFSLGMEGYEVVTALDGEQALEKARAETAGPHRARHHDAEARRLRDLQDAQGRRGHAGHPGDPAVGEGPQRRPEDRLRGGSGRLHHEAVQPAQAGRAHQRDPRPDATPSACRPRLRQSFHTELGPALRPRCSPPCGRDPPARAGLRRPSCAALDLAAHARFAHVALPLPLRQTFVYRVPDRSRRASRPARQVQVPFRGRPRRGFVVALDERSPTRRRARPRRRARRRRCSSPHLLALARWIADYYLAPLGEVLARGAARRARRASRGAARGAARPRTRCSRSRCPSASRSPRSSARRVRGGRGGGARGRVRADPAPRRDRRAARPRSTCAPPRRRARRAGRRWCWCPRSRSARRWSRAFRRRFGGRDRRAPLLPLGRRAARATGSWRGAARSTSWWARARRCSRRCRALGLDRRRRGARARLQAERAAALPRPRHRGAARADARHPGGARLGHAEPRVARERGARQVRARSRCRDRVDGRPLPRDARGRPAPRGRRERCCRAPLRAALGERLERGEQAMLFLNRRGHSHHIAVPRVRLRAGVPALRHRAHAPRRRRATWRCHYCDHERAARAPLCPSARRRCCASPARARSAPSASCAAAFPAARVLRLDTDVARAARGPREVARRVRARARPTCCSARR